MKVGTLSLGAALAVAASAPSIARTGAGDFFDSSPEQVHDVVWSGAGASAERAAACELHGDGLMDTVHLRDGDVVVTFAPAYYTAVENVFTGSYNDFDVAADLAANGADALVAVDASGVSILEFSPGVSEYLSSMDLLDPLWAGAQAVRVTRVGAVPGIVGLGADGDLLFRPDLEIGTSTTVVSDLGTVLAFAPYASPSGLEVAVVTPTAFLTVTSTAQIVTVATYAAIDDAICVPINRAGAPYDRVATVFRGSGAEVLHVYDETGAESTPLGFLDVYSMSAGDVDGDGVDDLVLANRSPVGAHLPLLLLNDPTGPKSFDWPNASVVDIGLPGNPPLTQAAEIVLADFSGDGDDDLGFFENAASRLRIAHNQRLDHRAAQLDIDGLFDVDWTAATASADLTFSFTPTWPGSDGSYVELWGLSPKEVPVEESEFSDIPHGASFPPGPTQYPAPGNGFTWEIDSGPPIVFAGNETIHFDTLQNDNSRILMVVRAAVGGVPAGPPSFNVVSLVYEPQQQPPDPTLENAITPDWFLIANANGNGGASAGGGGGPTQSPPDWSGAGGW